MAVDTREDTEIPGWIRRVGGIAWRFVAVAAALYLLAQLLDRLTVIVVPVALALLLAAVLEPVVKRLDRDVLPDFLVPLLAVLVVLVVVVGVVLGIGVRISDQLPELRDDFSAAVQDMEQRFSIEIPSLPGSDEASSGLAGPAGEVVKLGAEILFGLFLVHALAFLFLKDGRDMWNWFVEKLTPEQRERVEPAVFAAWGTLGTYVRGLTVVALFDAIGIAIGLWALGVPLVLTLAALQFFASYIPTIGAFVAGGVAAIVAFGTSGFATAALVVVLAIAVQQIGNDVIEPWIMGRTLPISPAVVLIAVSVGAALWGIAGALLLVPFVAAMSAAGHVLWEKHREVTL